MSSPPSSQPPPWSGDTISMAHGSGGRLTSQLLSEIFLPAFANDTLLALEDHAKVPLGVWKIAMTTDSFVVKPIFFPGGDIGRLAVAGTINDLVVGGAKPAYISAAFILQEGLRMEALRLVVTSMQQTCDEAGVTLVAGDTRVVEAGRGDQIFITTSGIGTVPSEREKLSLSAAKPGDAIVVSGTLGEHGTAVLSARGGFDLPYGLESDVAPLGDLVETLLASTTRVRCMRDPTRGGLAATLYEIAARSNVGIILDDEPIPFRPEVLAACEALRLDPLHADSAGRLVAVVDAGEAYAARAAMRAHPLGRDAAIIGRVTSDVHSVRVRTGRGEDRAVPIVASAQPTRTS